MATHRTNNSSQYKRVKSSYNQNEMNSSLRIPAGVYRGFVVDNVDPDRMGRVKVLISKFFNIHETDLLEHKGEAYENYNSAIMCRVMMPFGGNTPPADNGGQRAFGFTAPPPALNAEVLVAFNGESDKGIVLGVLRDDTRNAGIAGPAAGMSEDGEYTIVEELSKKSQKNLPPAHPQSKAIKKQGLNEDKLRGLNLSNPRREGQSRVFGFTTPDGHALILDDGEVLGDKKADGSADKQLIRLRTAGGAQILMDDTNGFTYIINRDGSSWIEMNDRGEIDVFSEGSINMHTQKDFNIHCGGNFNLQADQGINIKSMREDIRINALTADIHQKAGKNFHHTAGIKGHVNCGSHYIETAPRIDMNGPLAEIAQSPKVNQLSVNKYITSSVSARVPEHEPWKGHAKIEEVDGNSGTGSTSPKKRAETATSGGQTYGQQSSVPKENSPTQQPPVVAEDTPDEQPQVDPNTDWLIWSGGVNRDVDPALIAKVESVAKQFGRPLTITSGKRSESHNSSVGGAKRSRHIVGDAVDISAAGLSQSDRIKLIQLASANGIGGIGVYSSGSLHFDNRGGKAGWGDDFTSASVPGWALPAMNEHRRD